MIHVGVKRKQLHVYTINNVHKSMHCDLDLRPFDPKMTRAHPRLLGSICKKFHNGNCKGKAIMCQQPFS